MTQAVILAGGKGTRLASVSKGLPKPLVDVAGVPVVERQIALLVRYGIDEIFLTIGHGADLIEERLGDGSRFGASLHHVRESEPLGTAGGVAALRDQLHDDFLVLYGDVLVHMDLARLLRFHRERRADATLVVHPNDHPYDSDLVDLDDAGRVRAFHPKPRPSGAADLPNMVSAALYVLSPTALEHIEAGRPQDFVRDVFPRALASGAALYAYHTTEYLKDMGTPERLIRVTQDVERGFVEAMHADHLRPTLFLDRDGVINREIDGVRDPDQLDLLPGVGDALRRANQAGWLAACVTNQPLIAKGNMSEADLARVHRRLEHLLGEQGAWLDGLAYCPHHPESGFDGERRELKIACACRKPAPGMLERLAARLPVDRADSVVVGDSWRDMAAAHAFGAEAIGVWSGHGLRTPAPDDQVDASRPDVEVEDLPAAVSLLLDTDPAVEALAEQIRERTARADGFPEVVLLGGAARTGKSTTAFRLRRALRKLDLRTLWVRLDDWRIPEAVADPAATLAQRFQMRAIEAALREILAGRAARAPGYDLRARAVSPMPVVYDPRRAAVVLVEGSPALALELFPEALIVQVEAPDAEEMLARVHRYCDYLGAFGAGEARLCDALRAESEAVLALGERACVRFVPRRLATAREQTAMERVAP